MAVESTRWAVLYCPKRGLLDNSKKRWQRIEKALVKNNVAFDKVQSESQGSVERLVKMLINNGYKTILIIGGDSALNDAANCLMQVDKQVRDEITLGIIPNGIMNDFAHFWGIEDGHESSPSDLFPSSTVKVTTSLGLSFVRLAFFLM